MWHFSSKAPGCPDGTGTHVRSSWSKNEDLPRRVSLKDYESPKTCIYLYIFSYATLCDIWLVYKDFWPLTAWDSCGCVAQLLIDTIRTSHCNRKVRSLQESEGMRRGLRKWTMHQLYLTIFNLFLATGLFCNQLRCLVKLEDVESQVGGGIQPASAVFWSQEQRRPTSCPNQRGRNWTEPNTTLPD